MDKTIHKLKDNITILTEKHNYITNEIKEFKKKSNCDHASSPKS